MTATNNNVQRRGKALAVAVLACLVGTAQCGRTLQDYVRAVDGPAAVPFTSWPATPPLTLAQLWALEADEFVDDLPDSFTQQFEDAFLDDEDGLIFGDDGLINPELGPIDLSDFSSTILGALTGLGGQITDAFNFFGVGGK
ncbi:hypothetical protein HOP50_08g51620 [Chloropicon primus]|uniref:Uncharacterized protein n=1 Tax=Chloropicon primus TaxID=1764295 RepID=A0A5B8MQD9_9CHLO|nr:hypothetical protein A3770_08p51350 [Chloropicon primus]UPR01839.1 hypothetical protein HOP50_08g51620 [Chloropicon primus]|mmetsp:Transcript_2909/g.7890  ORF Transcript_2909/g.7890 Transcript_2909/m.7890 type:complete len:141 (+) Transcript_2909:242-664(+)|eukprot:QDZ22617.1 hypothetical protein A3770_08p51350 [Chloropicon primus]